MAGPGSDRPVSVPGVPSNTRLDGQRAASVRVQILHVPDCPLVEGLRHLLERSIAQSGVSATVEEVEGPYLSPTLLINGTDITGRSVGVEPSCRLDLPTAEEILAALTRSGTQQPPLARLVWLEE